MGKKKCQPKLTRNNIEVGTTITVTRHIRAWRVLLKVIQSQDLNYIHWFWFNPIALKQRKKPGLVAQGALLVDLVARTIGNAFARGTMWVGMDKVDFGLFPTITGDDLIVTLEVKEAGRDATISVTIRNTSSETAAFTGECRLRVPAQPMKMHLLRQLRAWLFNSTTSHSTAA